MNIVRCPPVTMVLIRRPDLRYQLGFSVQNGIVSMRMDHTHTHTQDMASCGPAAELLLPSLLSLNKSFYFVNSAVNPVCLLETDVEQ